MRTLVVIGVLAVGGCLCGCTSHVKRVGAAGEQPCFQFKGLGTEFTIWPVSIEFEANDKNAEPSTGP